MRLIATLFAIFALTTVAQQTPADENVTRSAELQVLGRFIGNWETAITIKTTGEKFKTVENRKWSKEGKFVLSEDLNLSTKKEAHFLLTYDPNAKLYRSCFIEEGNSINLLGTWDNDTLSMKWNGTDAKGIKQTVKYRFIDEDNVEWSMVVTGPDGKVLVELDARQKRREK